MQRTADIRSALALRSARVRLLEPLVLPQEVADLARVLLEGLLELTAQLRPLAQQVFHLARGEGGRADEPAPAAERE